MRARAARALLAFVLAVACGCARRGPVPIVTWHSVDGGEGAFAATPAQLAAQLDALVAAGFHSVSLHEALAAQDGGAPLPPKPIVLTFDDGTEDHFTTVLPLLRARGLRAAFFVVPRWTGPDAAHRRSAPGGTPCMTALELRALVASGMEVGAHGLTHARLGEAPDEVAREEIVRSRSELSALLGGPVELFAFPYNSLRARHRALVREAGYAAAVAGMVHGGADRFSLYRLAASGATSPAALVEQVTYWR